ncbi:hypothetical protein [Micromonospora sp. NPDC023956]|uniref:hypothetical protein n=1 Tax=Micromonospora sp. NPDC023956 TaxID=3155722 RepID=UPI0033C8F799
MTVRRSAARLAVVGALLGVAVVVGATPALADDDSVKVRASSSFTAGGSAGSVAVEVRKRSEGCVLLRTGLRLRLEGVRADQVEVQVSAGGQWWPVPVSGGDVLASGRTSPANPTLCKGKAITVRYRVTFLPGAPDGKLTVAGEATTAGGQTIGRGADTSKVRAGRDASPSPTPTKTPSPTPSPVETGPPTEGPALESTLAAVAGGGGQAADESGSGGGLSPVMVVGVALVVLGLGLIVLLFRRSGADRRGGGAATSTPVPPLPGSPGGTTYRSGGQPGAASAAGTGYGGGPVPGAGHVDDPAGHPVPPGGRAAGPTRGTVYPGSPRGADQPLSGGVHPATPPGPARPASPSGQTYGPAGRVYPAGSGQPGTFPPPEVAGGGDSTAIMPRLPE